MATSAVAKPVYSRILMGGLKAKLSLKYNGQADD
jgi:hypothetical protein